MKAIVLTYDEHAEICDLVLRTYEHLWPDHPFEFHVPFQDPGRVAPLVARHRDVRPVFTSSPTIKDAMRALLENARDDEWVWWCMVDKFLKAVDRRAVGRVCNWLPVLGPEVAGVMITRINHVDPHMAYSGALPGPPGGPLFVRKADWQHAIYQHQFLRARVLRELFLDPGFSRFGSIYDFEQHLHHFPGPSDRSLPYITTGNMLLFGESTYHGMLTPDCIAAFHMHGMSPPSHISRTHFNMPALRHVTGPDTERWQRELAWWDAKARPHVRPAERTVSAITYSKARLRHAAKSIPHLLSVLGPSDEIVLVDYNCPQGTGDWCKTLGDPRLKVVRVPQATWWWMNHARNCGGIHAGGDILLFMDIEGMPTSRNLAEIRAMHHGTYLRVGEGRDRNGTAAVWKHAFWEAGGYEEAIACYGHDEDTLYLAMQQRGIRETWLASEYRTLTTVPEDVDFRPGLELLSPTPGLPPWKYPLEKCAENLAIHTVLRRRHKSKNNVGRNWGLGCHLDSA